MLNVSPFFCWLWCYSLEHLYVGRVHFKEMFPRNFGGHGPRAHWETVWFNICNLGERARTLTLWSPVEILQQTNLGTENPIKSWARMVHLCESSLLALQPIDFYGFHGKVLVGQQLLVRFMKRFRYVDVIRSIASTQLGPEKLGRNVGMRPKVGIGSSVSSLVSLVIAGMFTWDFKSTKIHCRKRREQVDGNPIHCSCCANCKDPTSFLTAFRTNSLSFLHSWVTSWWAHNTGHLADHHRKSHQMTIQKPVDSLDNHQIPVVPHKAVAEVSKIGNL